MKLVSSKVEKYINDRWHHLQIDITNKCNTKCTYCVAHFMDRTIEDIPYDRIIATIDSFMQHSKYPYSIQLNCNAEPTCSNNLVQILQYIDSKYNGLIIYFNTNGLLLTDELYNCINTIKNNDLKISISCWGYDNVTFRQYHSGLNGFDKFENNIKRYLTVYNPKFHLAFSIAYVNHDFFEKMLYYLMDMCKGRELIGTNDGLDILDNNNIVVCSNIFFKNGNAYYGEKELDLQYYRDKWCENAYNTVNITNGGYIFPCVTVNSKLDYSIGNILTDDIWNATIDNIKSQKYIGKLCEGDFPFKYCNRCTSQYCNSKQVDGAKDINNVIRNCKI